MKAQFYSVEDIFVPIVIENTKKFMNDLEDIKSRPSPTNKISFDVKLQNEGSLMFEKGKIFFWINPLPDMITGERIVNVKASFTLPVKIDDSICHTFTVMTILDDGSKDSKLKNINDHLNKPFFICKMCFRCEYTCICDRYHDYEHSRRRSRGEKCLLCKKEQYIDCIPAIKCGQHIARFHTACILKHVKENKKIECPICKEALILV